MWHFCDTLYVKVNSSKRRKTMNEELLKGLSQEQIEKARKCKSTDELIILAKEEGVSLTDEQLAAVSGGFCSSTGVSVTCPKCNTKFNDEVYKGSRQTVLGEFTCPNCGHKFSQRV